MGSYINYEIDFENTIEWNDEYTKNSLENIDCEIMYLRNLNGSQRCILCLYSHYDIYQVLAILYSIYLSPMKYGQYGDGDANKYEWCVITAPMSRL